MRTSAFTPEQRRFALLAVDAGWPVPEVCRAYPKRRPSRPFFSDEEALSHIRRMASIFKTAGYRRIHEFLARDGFEVPLARLYRLYQADGLATRKQHRPIRATGRVGIPRDASFADEVWLFELVKGSYSDGRGFVAWQIMDAYTGEQLHLEVTPHWRYGIVGRTLRELSARLGAPLALHVMGDCTKLTDVYGWGRSFAVKVHEAPHAPSAFVTRARRLALADARVARLMLSL
jgi:hypothetical protein